MPDRFVRIRYFGLLAHRHRRRLLACCRELLGVVSPAADPVSEIWSRRLLRLTGFDALQCLFCKAGRLHLLSELASLPGLAPREPP